MSVFISIQQLSLSCTLCDLIRGKCTAYVLFELAEITVEFPAGDNLYRLLHLQITSELCCELQGNDSVTLDLVRIAISSITWIFFGYMQKITAKFCYGERNGISLRPTRRISKTVFNEQSN